MKFSPKIAFVATLFALSGPTMAADLLTSERMQASAEERGIWAAIAYSEYDSKHGFFWGADKRQEASDIALKHCRNAGGEDCKVVEVFRNHRHRDDNDDTGFPYNHCGVLAIGDGRHESKIAPWASRSAPTRREATDEALRACESGGDRCKVREWVCT